MNYPSTPPATWNRYELAEAMLSIALDGIPGWADSAWLLVSTARDAAPSEDRATWVQHAKDTFVASYSDLAERIVSDVRTVAGITPEQFDRFGRELVIALETRLAHLAQFTVDETGRA